MGGEVFQSFNQFVQDQKNGDGECYLSLVRFDNKVELVHDSIPIHEVPAATYETFAPRGMTALFDAVAQGITIGRTRKVGSSNQEPDKVLIMILTDGAENASQEITSKSQFSKLIKTYQSNPSWDFVFLGANQDAIRTGTGFGFDANACMTFIPEGDTCSAAIQSMSQNTRMYRSTGGNSSSLGFSELQRESSVQTGGGGGGGGGGMMLDDPE